MRDQILAHLRPNPLREGTQAPEWQLRDTDGNWHRNADGWRVLVFYRAADQLQRWADAQARFAEQEVTILGVNLVAEVAAVPTAADTDAAVSLRFQSAVVVMGSPRMVPTVYLINPEGKIRLANRGTPSPDAVLRSVVALKQATRRGL